jgi:hypothetical protein
MSQKSRNQVFSKYFCLMMEGSGSESGSAPLTNGSGKPKKTYKSGSATLACTALICIP